MNFSVYLAGNIAKSKEEKESFQDWRVDAEKAFVGLLPSYPEIEEVACYDPNTADYGSMPTEILFGRDSHMIKLSDALIVDTREKVGLGTAQEFLVAKYYSKPVVAVAPFRSYFNKLMSTSKRSNFHYMHPFLVSTADVLVDDFVGAAKVLLEHFSGRKKLVVKTINVIEEARERYEKDFRDKDEYMLRISEKE